MKKLFAGISVAVLGLGCLTACNETPSYNVNAAADFLDATYVNQIVDGRVDYEVLNTFTYGGATYTVEWSVDVSSGVVLRKDGDETIVDVDEASETDIDYVLTATVKDPNGNTASVDFYATLLKAPDKVPFAITEKPVEGTAYKLHSYNGVGKFDMYFSGAIASSFYLGSVKDYKASPDVYVEYVDGSDTLFNLYFNEKNDQGEVTKKWYFGIRQNWNGTKGYWAYNPYIEETPVSQFEYSATYGTIITEVPASTVQEEGAATDTTKVVYWGNSSTATKTYTTIGGMTIDNWGTADQGYVANLVTMGSPAGVSAQDKFNFEKEAVSFPTSFVGANTVNVNQIGSRYYDVKIAWEVVGDCISYDNGVITITSPEAETTITVKATVTLGDDLSETLTFTATVKPAVVVPDAGSTLTITEANELGAKFEEDKYTEGKYYVTGVVTQIKEMTKYGNLYISDDAGNTFYIYGLVDPTTNKFADIETLPELGDTITVYGVIGKHGSAQMKNGQLTELVPGTGEGPEYAEMTIPEALAAADNTLVQVSGTVSIVNGGWNTQHNNMNVTITDAQGNTLYVYRLATQVALGDIITVKGAMATYNSARQIAQGATAEITGHDNSYDYSEMTIVEANAAADGTNVIVSGTVSVVNGEWSTQHNNMNVTITDAQGNTLYVYRLATQVALGDIITVKGALTTYNGVKQIGQGGTATITGHDNSYDTPADSGSGDSSDGSGTVDPELPDTPEYAQMTISEALAAAEGTKVEITGTVNKLYEEWSSYNNMSPYITDGTAEILIFRTTTKVSVGDVITVKGVIGVYSNKNQIAQGSSTVEITQVHTCDYNDATCTTPATCKYCGATTGDIAADAHDYVNGICSICSGVDPDYAGEVVVPSTETAAIIANTGTLSSDSKSISWASENFTFVAEKGTNNNNIRTSDSDHFRIYQGNNFIISGKNDENISKIVFTTTSNDYATVLVTSLTQAGYTATANGKIVTLVASTAVTSVTFTTTAQTRVSSIEISYTK